MTSTNNISSNTNYSNYKCRPFGHSTDVVLKGYHIIKVMVVINSGENKLRRNTYDGPPAKENLVR